MQKRLTRPHWQPKVGEKLPRGSREEAGHQQAHTSLQRREGWRAGGRSICHFAAILALCILQPNWSEAIRFDGLNCCFCGKWISSRSPSCGRCSERGTCTQSPWNIWLSRLLLSLLRPWQHCSLHFSQRGSTTRSALASQFSHLLNHDQCWWSFPLASSSKIHIYMHI